MLTRAVRIMVSGVRRAVCSRRGGSTIATSACDESTLADTPLPPHWVRAGQPVTRTAWLFASGDGALAGGIWDCTAGKFDWHFDSDETVYVLEGSAVVQHGDATHILERGSVAYFPMGARTVWTVSDYVRKHFVHHHPAPLLRRLAGG